MIPFVLTLTFSILFILVFAISGIFLFLRWFAMLETENFDDTGDMKVPTFYATEGFGDKAAFFFCMPFGGVVFGGIHCVGWFFHFPSSEEAVLWRVSSAVLTGIAFIIPILITFVVALFGDPIGRIRRSPRRQFALVSVSVITLLLLVYVVSRLLLLLEAFISLRHLTPGMLALVKWTSFIPHI